MEYCTNCGAGAPDGAGFCSKCGSRIGPVRKEFKEAIGHRMKPGVSAGAWECYRSPGHKMLEATLGGLAILLFGVLIFIAATGISSLVTWSNFFACFLEASAAL